MKQNLKPLFSFQNILITFPMIYVNNTENKGRPTQCQLFVDSISLTTNVHFGASALAHLNRITLDTLASISLKEEKKKSTIQGPSIDIFIRLDAESGVDNNKTSTVTL